MKRPPPPATGEESSFPEGHVMYLKTPSPLMPVPSEGSQTVALGEGDIQAGTSQVWVPQPRPGAGTPHEAIPPCMVKARTEKGQQKTSVFHPD